MSKTHKHKPDRVERKARRLSKWLRRNDLALVGYGDGRVQVNGTRESDEFQLAYVRRAKC